MAETTAPPLIVHVIHHLVIGGMENGLVNIINTMPESSFRHAVLCVEDYSDFRQRIRRPGVEVVALRRSRIGQWGLWRELYRLFRQWQPAIVHSRNMSGLDALLPSRLAGVPVRVHGEHGWDVDNLDGRARKPLLLRKLHSPLVDHYVTVSQHLRDHLVQCVGVSADRITSICNGVDVRRFSPAAAAPAEWLPESFRGPDLVRIGTVGRLQRVKDQASLLRAFAAARDRLPALRDALRLVLVGDGPMRGDLAALAAQLRIEPVCHFAGARSDVAESLRSLDLFVLPSLAEGISNTVLEAMATGVPVIATAVGGNTELVDDGRTGQIVPAADVGALTAALAGWAGDAGRRRVAAAAARRRAEERFSLEAMVSAYEGVYRRLLARPR